MGVEEDDTIVNTSVLHEVLYSNFNSPFNS